MIIDHNNPKYRNRWAKQKGNAYNGAFYYSKEIVKYIIPEVETDRTWVTVNVEAPGVSYDHSLLFVHNNLRPEHYDWLAKYEDIVLVCSIGDTAKKMRHLGKTFTLPLSVDVGYVEQFIRDKDRKVAFAGRPAKKMGFAFPPGTDMLCDMPRERLLPIMARYEKIYAVGRTAIEAKILGCEVLPYDERYPNPGRWKILDSKDAAKILQEKLDKIDGRRTDD